MVEQPLPSLWRSSQKNRHLDTTISTGSGKNIGKIRKNQRIINLVGSFNHLGKYLSMGRNIPFIMENKKCSKPPTSNVYYISEHSITIISYIYMSYVSPITGWWLSHLPLWKMMDFVSWEDDIPNWMGTYNMFQTTTQILVNTSDIFLRNTAQFTPTNSPGWNKAIWGVTSQGLVVLPKASALYLAKLRTQMTVGYAVDKSINDIFYVVYTRGDWGSPMPSAVFECQHVKKQLAPR